MRTLLLLPLVLVLTGCLMKEPGYEVETLPNGDQLKLISVTEVRFMTNDEKWLVMEYRTDLDIDDVASIEAEVDKLWPYFSSKVEAAGLSVGGIKAVAKQTSPFTIASRSFVFSRAENGRWQRAEA